MEERPVVHDRPPTPVPPGPRWAVGDAVMGFLAALVLVALVQGIWLAVTEDDELTLGLAVTTFAAYWTGLVGAVVLASRRRGTGSLPHDLGLRFEPRDVPKGVLAGLVAQFVLVPLLYLPFQLLNEDLDVSEPARRTVDVAPEGLGLVVLAVCVVLLAPLVEELFFRGLVQRTLARRLGPAMGVAFSALAFAVTHWQPVQLLGLLAFGILLGVLAERSGRLGPSVVAHATFNAASVAILVLT